MSNPCTPRRTRVVPGSERGRMECGKSADKRINSILNTAFKQSMSMPKSPAPVTPRFQAKTTTLNACYTPSSLFRNNGRTSSTPGTRTPGGLQNAAKETQKPSKSTPRNMEVSNLTVAVRIRPLNEQECTIAGTTNVVNVRENEIIVNFGTSADGAAILHSFMFDKVFCSMDSLSSSYATQSDVYAGIARNLLDQSFKGYNACLFAYGQTGSGKSYTMMGSEHIDGESNDASGLHSEAGITPRFCHELFERIDALKGDGDAVKAEIEISYFEIYNEKIYDLLCTNHTDVGPTNISADGNGNAPQACAALKVREHPIWGPYVVNLSVHPVTSLSVLQNWLALGHSHRATASTGMNTKSSRSHSILNIMLTLTKSQQDAEGELIEGTNQKSEPQTRRSKICLVDLAGSERLNSAAESKGNRIKEGVCINKSLLTLGKVIAALADNKFNQYSSTGTPFVPYRESVLTWLLRESLGGNSKTVMLATISPSSMQIDETMATLRYACQARNIVNRVRVNESAHDKIIRELRAEVERLKSLQTEFVRQRRISSVGSKEPVNTTTTNDAESLIQQLTEREKELTNAEKSWMERVQDAENQRLLEIRLLRRKGLALELSAEQRQVCMVNLTEDPILSGTLFYLLPPGRVRIGRLNPAVNDQQLDIILNGSLVAHNHCVVENINQELYVEQEDENFETYLNGELIATRAQMYHGDRLIIGGIHYFRISNPFCTQTKKSKVVDFRQAHQEILHKQERKIRVELELEKSAALGEIERERIENERNFRERIQQFELEQLKFTCSREILQTEQNVLRKEMQIENSNCTDSPAVTASSALKSNLLEDIKNIMQLPSEESLHKTQVMVKEATELCRNHGLQLEFQQSQLLDEFGMFRTVVQILDQKNRLQAEWPSARLGVWLEIMRDNTDNVNYDNIFASVDIDWKPVEHDNGFQKSSSPRTKRVSINLNKIRGTLLNRHRLVEHHASPPGNRFTQCNDRAQVPSTLPYIGQDSILKSTSFRENDLKLQCTKYIDDIRSSTVKLKQFLNEKGPQKKDGTPFFDSLKSIESHLDDMQSYLST